MAILNDKGDAGELMVLGVLAERALYGYAISKEVSARTQSQLNISPGVLYPMLAALERDGLIVSSWEEVKSERSAANAAGRRRKWYSLTPRGRKRLEQRVQAHRTFLSLIERFIGPAHPSPETEASS